VPHTWGFMSRNYKLVIIVAAAVTAILIVIGIASCGSQNQKLPEPSTMSLSGGGYAQSGFTSCAPPLACGPYYAGYVPPYYAAHPSFVYLTPYRAYYTPVFNGRSYTVAQSPTGRAAVTSRTPMPYPAGYKPVPGDFQAPTAPKVPPAPAVKAPSPVKAPAVPRVSPPRTSTGR
jgi:hypothetical protein